MATKITITYRTGSPANTVLDNTTTATLTLVPSAGYQYNNRNVLKLDYVLDGTGTATLNVNLPSSVSEQEFDVAYQAGDATRGATWKSSSTSATFTFSPTGTPTMHAMVVGAGRSVDVNAKA
ncbi:MAG: hypothetical protein U0168_10215 [Nannocystaceae bacterium]